MMFGYTFAKVKVYFKNRNPGVVKINFFVEG